MAEQKFSQISQRSEAEQSKLSIALVGLGRVALKHVKALRTHHNRFEIIGLVDVQSENAARIWKEAGMKQALPPLYPSVEALLSEMQPQAAAICTPSGLHFAQASAFIERGIHCFIEKPMTLDLEEAEKLRKMAAEHKVQIALGYIYRFFPLVDLIREDLLSGKLGRVLGGSVEIIWGHDQAYYDAAAWRGSWAADGGVLMNQCIHAVDLMTWLMQGNIIQTKGFIDRREHQMEAEDFGRADFLLDQGTHLELLGTTNGPKDDQRAAFQLHTEQLDLHGGIRRGKVFFSVKDKNNHSLVPAYLRRLLRQMFASGFLLSLKGYLNPHTGIYLDFAQAIHDKRAPRASALAGYDALAAILSVYASAIKGGEPSPCPPPNFKLNQMQGWKPIENSAFKENLESKLFEKPSSDAYI